MHFQKHSKYSRLISCLMQRLIGEHSRFSLSNVQVVPFVHLPRQGLKTTQMEECEVLMSVS